MTPPRRTRRHRHLHNTAPQLDMTPMVDVVFTLVIFFMVSTTFITMESGLPIELPQSQSSSAQASDQTTVTIANDGTIYLAGAQVSEDRLAAALETILARQQDKTVVVRADKDVRYGLPVRIMDIIRQAGAERVAIATGGQ